MGPLVLTTMAARTGEGNGMNLAPTEMSAFQEILERKQAELVRVLRKRDDIAIEKSADQMDEIQFASERDLAIRNVDRDSALIRQVKASLRRIHDGSYGTCVECEEAISPKRLVAVPWAPRCIHCQNAADRERQDITESFDEPLVNAA
jgi:DnaK suppressor protein